MTPIARRAAVALVLTAMAAAAVPVGAQRAPLPLTPVERPVLVTRPGPQRLMPDATFVAGAKRGDRRAVSPAPGAGIDLTWQVVAPFADLRLVDADGREVPYLLIPPELRRPAVVEASQVVSLPATKTTSGVEAMFDTAQAFAEIAIGGIPAPFLKRVRLEGSVDRAHWVELAGAATVFSLPLEDLRLARIAVAPIPVRFVRIVFDDTTSAPIRVAPSVTGHPVRTPAPPPVLDVAMPFERIESATGTTTYRVRLPGARLPIVAVRLDATNPEIHRQVRIAERPPEAAGMPVLLGSASLTRVRRDGLVAGSLTVPVNAPSTAALDIVVDDGANPALSLTAVHVVFAHLPRIYFEASDTRPLRARYGRTTATAPAYDLEAARRVIDVDAAAEAAWGAVSAGEAGPDPTTPGTPVPGAGTPSTGTPMGANATVNAAPPAAPVPVFAARVDRRLFRYARSISVGPPGRTRLPLDVAVLAHSATAGHRLDDVRLIDPDGRQIPFVLGRLERPLVVSVAVPNATRTPATPQVSSYVLDLPAAGLPDGTLVLTTTARVFTRRVAVAAQQPSDERHREPWTQPVGAATWTHHDPSTVAEPLRVALPSLTTRRVIVTIDEGDNQPLALDTAQLELPARVLDFVRPADTTLELVYGQARLPAPRYDLAPTLLDAAAPAVDAALDEERALEPLPQPALVTPPMFWTILVAATLALLVVLARLLRAPDPADPAGGSEV